MLKNTATNVQLQDACNFAQYGYEYIVAARVVDHEIGSRNGHEFISPTPAYFLSLHGIELTLKAFLCKQGVTAHELGSKAYGHDLRKCYRKSKELGLLSVFKIKAADVKAMAMLVRLNKYQGLRYRTTGFKRYPSWAIVEPLAVRLHQAVASFVGHKTFDIFFPNYNQDSK